MLYDKRHLKLRIVNRFSAVIIIIYMAVLTVTKLYHVICILSKTPHVYSLSKSAIDGTILDVRPLKLVEWH